MLLFSPWQSHSCATGFGSRRVSAISNTVLAVDCSGARPGYPFRNPRKPNQAPLFWVCRPHSPVCRELMPGVSGIPAGCAGVLVQGVSPLACGRTPISTPMSRATVFWKEGSVSGGLMLRNTVNGPHVLSGWRTASMISWQPPSRRRQRWQGAPIYARCDGVGRNLCGPVISGRAARTGYRQRGS
jgi:hypothetical protein